MKNKIILKAVCILESEQDTETDVVTLVGINNGLIVSENLDRSRYFDKNNLPNATGTEALTVTLIQGLLGNIHYARLNNFRDSAEHLRFIIAELERGFVQQAEIAPSNFNKK